MGARHIEVVPPENKATHPHSVEYENDAGGVAYLYPHHADVLFDALSVEDFFSDAAQQHFSAMLTIHRRGEVVDRPALERVEANGLICPTSRGFRAGCRREPTSKG